MIVKYILVLCVFLSLLLLSISSIAQNNLAKATFAGGCFWCMESPFEKMEGVISVVSGYTGGHKEDPSYQEVSAGVTGHMEADQILYDPSKINFSELLNVFWRQIDPTDPGGQFVDRGDQYGTAVFYHNEEQRILAEKSKEELAKSGIYEKPIVTKIFHENKRAVITASHDQVRRPIYNTSVGRWKKYGPEVMPLVESLSEFMDESERAVI